MAEQDKKKKDGFDSEVRYRGEVQQCTRNGIGKYSFPNGGNNLYVYEVIARKKYFKIIYFENNCYMYQGSLAKWY